MRLVSKRGSGTGRPGCIRAGATGSPRRPWQRWRIRLHTNMKIQHVRFDFHGNVAP